MLHFSPFSFKSLLLLHKNKLSEVTEEHLVVAKKELGLCFFKGLSIHLNGNVLKTNFFKKLMMFFILSVMEMKTKIGSAK